MKEYFKRLFGLYIEILGVAVILIIVILAGIFLCSPIGLSIYFNNAWYLMLYGIIVPAIKAIDG